MVIGLPDAVSRPSPRTLNDEGTMQKEGDGK